MCFALDVVKNHYAVHFLIASPTETCNKVARGDTQQALRMFKCALAVQLATSPCIWKRLPDTMSSTCCASAKGRPHRICKEEFMV